MLLKTPATIAPAQTPSSGPATGEMTARLRSQLFDEYVIRKLLVVEAGRAGVAIDDAEVTQVAQENPQKKSAASTPNPCFKCWLERLPTASSPAANPLSNSLHPNNEAKAAATNN